LVLEGLAKFFHNSHYTIIKHACWLLFVLPKRLEATWAIHKQPDLILIAACSMPSKTYILPWSGRLDCGGAFLYYKPRRILQYCFIASELESTV